MRYIFHFVILMDFHCSHFSALLQVLAQERDNIPDAFAVTREMTQLLSLPSTLRAQRGRAAPADFPVVT